MGSVVLRGGGSLYHQYGGGGGVLTSNQYSRMGIYSMGKFITQARRSIMIDAIDCTSNDDEDDSV